MVQSHVGSIKEGNDKGKVCYDGSTGYTLLIQQYNNMNTGYVKEVDGRYTIHPTSSHYRAGFYQPPTIGVGACLGLRVRTGLTNT